MKKILVAGIRSPIAHDLISALNSAGFEVFGADCFAPHTIKKHLPKTKILKYAPPALYFASFEKDCIRIISEIRPDLIIPMNEEVFYWAKFSEKHGAPLFAPPLSQLMMLHSKKRFIDFCSLLGLNVPRTEFYDNGEFENKVFKPEFSRFGEKTIIKPNSRPKFAKGDGRIIVQDFIEGEDLSFYAIAIKGKITAFSAYKSQWRANGGAALFFEPFHDSELLNAAQKICFETNYTGQISCDLRRDIEGRNYFIECNPRGTSGLHNIAKDPNFAHTFFETELFVEPKSGNANIALAMLIYGLPKAIKYRNLKQFFLDFTKARDVFKGNNIGLVLDSIFYFREAAKQKLSLSAFLTHDIECNQDLCADETTV